jgi:hypothetical protein
LGDQRFRFDALKLLKSCIVWTPGAIGPTINPAAANYNMSQYLTTCLRSAEQPSRQPAFVESPPVPTEKIDEQLTERRRK